MRVLHFFLAITFFLSLGAAPAVADAIFVNGTPTSSVQGFTIDGLVTATEFTPDVSGNITDLTFWVSTFSLVAPDSTAISWYLFADAGALPASVPLASGVESTFSRTFEGSGQTVSYDFSLYRYDLSLGSPVALSAGTTYWFGLATNASSGEFWRITDPEVQSSLVQASIAGPPFSYVGPFVQQMPAFELHGTTGTPPTAVPEPSSFGLFSAGLIGLAAIRRRRHQ